VWRVLVPLPAPDFDPSEAAVSWRVLADAGHTVRFATPDGCPAVADDMMLTGKGLDPWGAIPLLQANRIVSARPGLQLADIRANQPDAGLLDSASRH